MARSGFITNTAVTNITSTSEFTSTLLAEQTTGTPSDAKSRALPQSCSLSQLDLVLTEYTGTGDIAVYMTWDSTGDDPLTSKITGVEVNPGGTSGTVHCVISLDKLFVTAPSGQSEAGKCYVWIKPAEPCKVSKARLHWHTYT